VSSEQLSIKTAVLIFRMAYNCPLSFGLSV